MDTESDNFNDRLDKAMDVLGNDPALQDEQNTEGGANDPASPSNTKPPVKDAIGEDQNKPSDAKTDKPQGEAPAAIEPPANWPNDDKEAFKQLPTFLQERVVAREHEREAFFSERSRAIAARENELNTVQARAQQAQQQYASELQRLTQLAAQLMPAKFNDITSEADYLRMKVEDPARHEN